MRENSIKNLMIFDQDEIEIALNFESRKSFLGPFLDKLDCFMCQKSMWTNENDE